MADAAKPISLADGMTDPVVVRTIMHEGGNSPSAQAAVAWVIRNRAEQTGKTPLEVVQQKSQFEGVGNRGYLKGDKDPKAISAATDLARNVAVGAVVDPTAGGTMFHASSMTPYWAKSANKNGTVNIGGNIFYKGSGASPQTAVAAIDAIAPNPQSRPPALGYASTPASVRSISVNPDGSPSSLADALMAKYGSATVTPRGASGASVSGLSLPDAMPVARVASRVPTVPQSLVSHPVQTVRIDPFTGNPVGSNNPVSLQDAVNAKAQRIATGQEQFTPTKTTSIVPRLSNPSGATKTVAQAGNVGLPAGIVPQSVQRDMAAINAMQANRSGSPDDRGIVPSNPFSGVTTTASLVPKPVPGPSSALSNSKNTARLTVTPSPVLAYNGDQNTGIPSGVAAINSATNPFAGARASVGGSIVPRVQIQARPYSPTATPLTSFNTVNPTSQIVPRVTSTFNTTPVGHLAQLMTGQPVQGGLLGMLFGGGLGGGSTPVSNAVTGPDPLQAAVLAAQQQGQTYDRSRDPSFNPNGGAHGGSLAGF